MVWHSQVDLLPQQHDAVHRIYFVLSVRLLPFYAFLAMNFSGVVQKASMGTKISSSLRCRQRHRDVFTSECCAIMLLVADCSCKAGLRSLRHYMSLQNMFGRLHRYKTLAPCTSALGYYKTIREAFLQSTYVQHLRSRNSVGDTNAYKCRTTWGAPLLGTRLPSKLLRSSGRIKSISHFAGILDHTGKPNVLARNRFTTHDPNQN